MDSFGDKLKRFANKVNDKLEESISAAEERTRSGNERNQVYRQKLEEIEKDIAKDEELLKRFNDTLGLPDQKLREVDRTSVKDGEAQPYLSIIEDILRDHAGPAILDSLSDRSKLAELARSGYQVLPMPAGLIVREQSFIDWVVSHQSDIAKKLGLDFAPEASTESSLNSLPAGDPGKQEVDAELD